MTVCVAKMFVCYEPTLIHESWTSGANLCSIQTHETYARHTMHTVMYDTGLSRLSSELLIFPVTWTMSSPLLPLAAGTRTYPVQAVYARKQVLSWYGAVVPGRHVHSRVVHRRSATSPLSCSSRSYDSAQSAGAIGIKQLRHFRFFALELAAVDYSWLDPDIRWLL